MSGHPGFGGLLRQRNFRLLWTGETTSQLGNAMAGVAMPLLAAAAWLVSTAHPDRVVGNWAGSIWAG